MAHDLQSTGAGSGNPEVRNCVSNLIHAFTNGVEIFRRLRERRRKRKSHNHASQTERPSGEELQLSTSLRRGPQDLQECYEEHYGKAGDPFARGDAIAHASLAETLVKLNTGLVTIIAAFLGRDSTNKHLNLDYKSLTNLSESSRTEAIDSLNQLYRRLSRSQLSVYQLGSCPRCGSNKHLECSGRAESEQVKHVSGRKRHSGPKARPNGITIARVPIKSSTQTQLVVLRPKNTRKNSSSSSSSTYSPSTALSSPNSLSLGSPRSQNTVKDPTSAPQNITTSKPATNRRYPSTDGSRAPVLPYTNDEPDIAMPLPRIPSPEKQHPTSLQEGPVRRRMDKITPSSYTFASDSTKLGEIPQKNWTTPFNYEEAERLNAEALVHGYPTPAAAAPKPKKGLFKFLRRGTAAAS